ncbi:hypothetical protein HN789_07480 [archaeon]|jgi:hypothetical protein|nr:hypothetical protein [archaeon]MBT4272236.1 hypothetical protein [archaeon]MBT4460611.1 hypothetical protein [archaeon]MBT4857978.1 hypothetical protein [archaeon]MBT5424175.1 hypothetical protein [archaeon]
MKLPEYDKLEFITSNPNNNQALLSKIYKNIKSIKRIEQENLDLKKHLIEHKTNLNEKKFQDLINILNHKEKKFQEFHKKIILDYNTFKQGINHLLILEKQKYKKLESKHTELLIFTKKIKDENKNIKEQHIRIKYGLKKDFEKRVNKLLDEHKLKQRSHKNILKEVETFKLDKNKQTEILKDKVMFLARKNNDLRVTNVDSIKDNQKLKALNNKLVFKINELNSRSLGNKHVLEKKVQVLRSELENKLREITKQHISKEIEYKSKIDSLQKDLSRYYSELKSVKLKYVKREKELKEKISNLLN